MNIKSAIASFFKAKPKLPDQPSAHHVIINDEYEARGVEEFDERPGEFSYDNHDDRKYIKLGKFETKESVVEVYLSVDLEMDAFLEFNKVADVVIALRGTFPDFVADMQSALSRSGNIAPRTEF